MTTVSIYVNQEQAAFAVKMLKEMVSVTGWPSPGAMLYVTQEYYNAMQLAIEFLEEAAEK